MIKKLIVGAIFGAVFLSGPVAGVQAMEITQLANMPVEGDFVLGPGKVELFLDPGETAIRTLNVTNRSGKALKVIVEKEDFTGDAQNSTRLLGDEAGPYSLKDLLVPEKEEFVLAHGEKASLPVTISVPSDMEPGGRYGAMIFRVEPENLGADETKNEAQGSVSLVSRLATLFFVRIKGPVKEEGALKSFTAGKSIYQKSPVNFSVVYENKGSVHLNPYAQIEIKNILGKKVDAIEIQPWFVMPGFTREKVISWDKGLAFGRYTAVLSLNRGYGNLVDEQKTSFWVIPVKVIAAGLLAIAFLAFVIWWFASRFELKRKK
ncbi:MAG: hypothetical protein WCW77_03810 [Patescibacteria group bacterium]|jgi:hypothetical protein